MEFCSQGTHENNLGQQLALFNFKLMRLAICPRKWNTRWKWPALWNVVESMPNDPTSIKIEEWNQCNRLDEKWWGLVGSWAEILPVVEGTKWMCVGD